MKINKNRNPNQNQKFKKSKSEALFKKKVDKLQKAKIAKDWNKKRKLVKGHGNLVHTQMKFKTINIDENVQLENLQNDGFIVGEDDPIFHFKGVLNDGEANQLSEIQNWCRSVHNYEYMGRSFVEIPDISISERSLPDISIELCPYLCQTPLAGNYEDLTSSFAIRKYTKEQLVSRIPAANGFSDSDDIGLTPLQNEILSVIGRYADLYYTEAKPEHHDEIRFAYCLHILNHLSKCRTEIVHNNEILNNKEFKFNANRESYRDQSFTRPKVLILTPFKNAAYKLVKKIISILFEKGKGSDIHNLSRFEEDYGLNLEKKVDKLNRPADYHITFEGDISENFKIGVKLTKGTLKLYSDFYHSDIIIASPLGARLSIGSKKTKNFDTDFLSSIEIAILDQADALLMQNWDNVLTVLDHLNLHLREVSNATNIPRTREWNARGLSSYYRQTIVFSSFLDIHQRNVYMKSRNYAGRVEVINQISEGSIKKIIVRSELNMWFFEDSDPVERRKYFLKNILPSLSKLNQVLLYIPDYYDYILLVNYLRFSGGIEFSTLNEYMINEEAGNISEARSAFYERRHSMIIMTERFHFYRRYRIKGIKNVMFYSLPSNPHFVPEVCNWMADEYQHPHLEVQETSPLITVMFDKSTITNMCHFIGTAKTRELWNSKRKFSTISVYAEEP